MAMIKNIWAENANNKNNNFTETQIGDGITAKSSILSSQLNGIAYRNETFIDILQRASAYNAGKTYNQGDLCFVAINFKKASDTAGKRYIMVFTSNVNNNTAEPLVRKSATSFTVNNDLVVPLYTITQSDDTTLLSSYANSAYWNANDMTMGDLSNAVNLVVSGNSTFKKSLNINGNLTMPNASMSNGVLKANAINVLDIQGVSGNTTTIDTPPYNVSRTSTKVINAEWYYNKDRERLSALLSEYRTVSLFNNSTKWTNCDFIAIYYITSGSYAEITGNYENYSSYIMTPLEIIVAGLNGSKKLINAYSYFDMGHTIYHKIDIIASSSMNEYSSPFSIGGGGILSCVGFIKK